MTLVRHYHFVPYENEPGVEEEDLTIESSDESEHEEECEAAACATEYFIDSRGILLSL